VDESDADKDGKLDMGELESVFGLDDATAAEGGEGEDEEDFDDEDEADLGEGDADAVAARKKRKAEKKKVCLRMSTITFG